MQMKMSKPANQNYFKKNRNTKSTKSIKLTVILMQLIGMWHVSSAKKYLLSNASLCMMLLSMIVSSLVQTQALYFSQDILSLIYIAPCASIVFSEITKLLVFMLNRSKILALNKEIERKIWSVASDDDEEEMRIFNDCDRLCFRAIAIYTFLLQLICWHYLLAPAIESINTEDSERTFPFPLYFGLPIIMTTPYYEIIFFLEIFGTMAVSLCATIFASYLFAINMFNAAQFKILNLRLRLLCDLTVHDAAYPDVEARIHRKLKDCIRIHQQLIDYVDRVENLYCFVMLGQIFSSVTQICFSGLQMMLSDSSYTSAQRRVLSLEYLLGSFCQLYFYCYSSHEIFMESELVSRSIYFSKWFRITDPAVRKDFSLLVQIVAHRARRPCILTVGKFCPLNLDTFSSVLSTSLSYYTVLRKTMN